MYFILTVTSLAQFYSSRTWLQFEEMGSYLGVIFNGVKTFAVLLDANETAVKQPSTA